MKPMRFLTVAIILLGMVATASALTPAGAIITNQAKGAYDDANGNEVAGANTAYVYSNTVSTEVSQVAGASLGSNQAESLAAMASALYDVTFTNTGNGTDWFTFQLTESDANNWFSIEIFHDINNDGVVDAGEEMVSGDTTGSLDYTDTYNLLVRVTDTNPNGSPDGTQHVGTLRATSNHTGSLFTEITLTTTVQAAAVNGTIAIVGTPDASPEGSIDYEACFTNSGGATAYGLIFSTVMPDYTTLDQTSVSINGGTALTLPSASPAASYNTETRVLTINLGDLGYTTGTNEVCVQFSVVVDSDLPAGTGLGFPANSPSLTYDNPGGDPYPTEYPEESGTTLPGDLTVTQVYGVTLAVVGTDAFTGDPSDTFTLDFTVTNTGNGADLFQLTTTSTYVVWVFYADSNNDGIADGSAITNTGSLGAGAVGNFIAIGTIPAGTADAESDASTITATSQGDDLLYDETDASSSDTASATCTAPVVTLAKSSPQGYDAAANEAVVYGAPGSTITYTVIVTNTGSGAASNVVVSDAIPGNTSYVADSMTVDGATVDDDNPPTDDDVAAYTGTDVVWRLGDLAPSAFYTLTFQVTIN